MNNTALSTTLTTRSTLKEIRSEIWRWVDEAVDGWYREQCRDTFKSFYAYYRPSKGTQPGHIVIAEQKPNGYQPITGERISGFESRQQVKTKIYNLTGRLPLLPVE